MEELRSDDELVEAHRGDGDPAAFETLVLRHREAALRVVLATLGPEDRADAEDVVQQAFLRAHDRIGSFRGTASFRTWLHRIARNLALDHGRVQRRRRRLLERETERVPGDAEVALPDERTSGVRQALLEVPEPQRTALRLHYWLGLSVAEIAESFGVREGTAKSWLHRGRARLLHVMTRRGKTS
ncbi:MAG: RNA polymerase sigma factor [Acidobacteriota bacterium]